MANLFDAIDWADIFRVEPGIGLTIISKDGSVLYSNEAAQTLFGSGPLNTTDAATPKKLSDIFHPDFVRERLAWINQVIDEVKPLRAEHFYNGQLVVSTFYPIGESTARQFQDQVPQNLEENDNSSENVEEHISGANAEQNQNGDGQSDSNGRHYALIISRHHGREKSESIDTVTSQYIDLGALSSLSKREFEIFILLGHGNSVPEVGRMLHRSPRTIERHKTEIGRKLGYSSLAEIARAVGHVGLTYDHIQLERLKAVAAPPPAKT